jgi:hypothetical protein
MQYVMEIEEFLALEKEGGNYFILDFWTSKMGVDDTPSYTAHVFAFDRDDTYLVHDDGQVLEVFLPFISEDRKWVEPVDFFGGKRTPLAPRPLPKLLL